MATCNQASTATIYTDKPLVADINCGSETEGLYGLPVSSKPSKRSTISAEVLSVTVNQDDYGDSTAMGGNSFERVVMLRTEQKLEVGWQIDITDGWAWTAFSGKIKSVMLFGAITRLIVH